MKYIYTIYLWIVGGFSFLFISSFALIGVKFTTPDKIYFFTSFFFKILFKVLFIRVEVENLEQIDKNKSRCKIPYEAEATFSKR